MKDKLIVPETIKRENLHNVYELLNRICKNDNLFYTKEEVKKLKKDQTIKWL